MYIQCSLFSHFHYGWVYITINKHSFTNLTVVALIINNHKLWVANVGDSRAVLCYLDRSGKLHAEQISEDHNTRNDKEIARLVECGLDELSLRSSGRLGVHQNTRSIGDYSIKGGYKDHDILR